jgi:sialate O-acetylesterase
MQFGLGGAQDAKDAIAAAKFPLIRHITVANVNSKIPLEDIPTSAPWTVCDPRTAASFSAVAFYFGRELHTRLQVPVGLIHSSWGGTAIEPWTPPEGFASVTNFAPVAAAVARTEEQSRKELAAMLDGIDAWSAAARRALADKAPVPVGPNPSGFLQNAGPSGIYNAMIRPLIPYAIRGAIWYQGESNFLYGKDGMIYKKRMEALVGGWRKVWEQGDFPFYYVQIAPFKYNAAQPQDLALFWEAQTAAMEIPNTGMAVINDIGDANDIHPRKKAEVGCRLALWALAKTYGQKDLVYSGPLYKSMEVDGARVRLTFDHVGGGLAARDGKPLDSFEIAGSDGKFVPAQAEIDGRTIVVSSDPVPQPVTVRFAWSNIACPNLMNKEGLPASSFRTGNR